MKKIGIIGGTFDPVHRGHIDLALDSLNQAGLDRVLFMPAKEQPFKQNQKVSSENHRMNMIQLALEPFPGLSMTTVEMDREGLSYTFESLRLLRAQWGQDTQSYFILGADSYLKLSTWKNARELLTENHFIVGKRPGFVQEALGRCQREYRESFGTQTLVLENRQWDLSSTVIRQKKRQGASIEALVPQGVDRYIEECGLYL